MNETLYRRIVTPEGYAYEPVEQEDDNIHLTDKGQIAWRKGFEAGTQTALRQNDIALRVGQAILSALDDRYEFKKEDY